MQEQILSEYTTANTWKKVTVTIPNDSSLVFDNNSDGGLELSNLAIGSTRNDGTADQWNSVSTTNVGTSNQVNFFDSTSNEFYLTGVQLEVGDTDTHHSSIDHMQKKHNCQRYFETRR